MANNIKSFCTVKFNALTLTTTSYTKRTIASSENTNTAMFSVGTDSVTVLKSGYYRIGYSAQTSSGFEVNDIIHTVVYKNGSTELVGAQCRVSTTSPYQSFPCTPNIFSLSAGDVLSFNVRNQTGSRGMFSSYQSRDFGVIEYLGS